MKARFGDSPVADLEKLTADRILVPRTGVVGLIAEATASFDPALSITGVSTGSVGQALAANDHGLVVATEQVGFGLQGLPAKAQGQPLASLLYVSWDSQHYASAEISKIAQDFKHWMSVTPPWSEANS